MTGGTEFQEAVEAPQEKIEVTEALVDLDKATFEAPSKVEEGDIQSAEDTQKEFVAVVMGDVPDKAGSEGIILHVVDVSRTPPTPAVVFVPQPYSNNAAGENESSQKVVETTRKTPAAESSLDGQTHDPGDHYSGVDMTQGEVLQDNDLNNNPLDSEEPADNTLIGRASPSESGLPLDGSEGSPDSDESESDSAEPSSGEDNKSTSIRPAEADDQIGKPISQSKGGSFSSALSTAQKVSAGISSQAGSESSIAMDLTGAENTTETIDSNTEAGSSDKPQSEPSDGANGDSSAAGTTSSDPMRNGSTRESRAKVIDSSDDADFAQDMTGATPGEVRGFDNDTDNNPYILETTGESDEVGENQIVIPSGNSQIDFAGIAGEVQKTNPFVAALGVAKDEVGDFRVPSLHQAEIDPLPGRDPSGDYLEIPADSSNLELTQQESSEGAREASDDPMAMATDVMLENYSEASQDLQDMADDVQSQTEMKKSTREEISMLQDELSDWPDGETREITYTDWEKQADGTYVKVEKTEIMTKDQAENLMEKMEQNFQDTDERVIADEADVLYQLEEGSMVVGEAELDEFPLTIGDNNESTQNYETKQYWTDLMSLIQDFFTMKSEDNNMLDNELSDWPDGETRTLTYRVLSCAGDYQLGDELIIYERTQTLTRAEAISLRASPRVWSLDALKNISDIYDAILKGSF